MLVIIWHLLSNLGIMHKPHDPTTCDGLLVEIQVSLFYFCKGFLSNVLHKEQKDIYEKWEKKTSWKTRKKNAMKIGRASRGICTEWLVSKIISYSHVNSMLLPSWALIVVIACTSAGSLPCPVPCMREVFGAGCMCGKTEMFPSFILQFFAPRSPWAFSPLYIAIMDTANSIVKQGIFKCLGDCRWVHDALYCIKQCRVSIKLLSISLHRTLFFIYQYCQPG